MPDTTYTTIQGETWDQISVRVYGREVDMHHLIEANPAYTDTMFFASGVVLAVPAIPKAQVVEVPQWKQR